MAVNRRNVEKAQVNKSNLAFNSMLKQGKRLDSSAPGATSAPSATSANLASQQRSLTPMYSKKVK